MRKGKCGFVRFCTLLREYDTGLDSDPLIMGIEVIVLSTHGLFIE